MKTLLLLVSLGIVSCATTTFYRNGQPVARFSGDMKNMTFSYGPDGSIRWSADVSHSVPTRAYGEASQSRIAAVAGLAAYAISK